MRHGVRMALALVVVTGALAFGLATASASRLSFSGNDFRIVWAALNFNNNMARCQVTMEGSFTSRTFGKSPGIILGRVTRAVTGECEVGSAWILGHEELTNTLPWIIRYDSFTGRLPAISTIRVRIPEFSAKYRMLGTETCLYRGFEAMPAYLDLHREAGGALTVVRFLPERTIPWIEESSEIFCEIRLSVSGSGNPTLLERSTRITVTLI